MRISGTTSSSRRRRRKYMEVSPWRFCPLEWAKAIRKFPKIGDPNTAPNTAP